MLLSMRHIVLLLLWIPAAFSCTLIIIGKHASVDGSAMLAHTDDAGGDTTDVRLVHVPAMDHAHRAKRAVYSFNAGYPRVVTHERGPHYAPKDGQEVFQPMGYIPQVRHTYAYFDHNYGLMNEMGLAVAETTAGARTAGWPKKFPYGHSLFDIAELSKVALERCVTARCAIQTMGDLAVEYGFYTGFTGTPQRTFFDDSAEVLGVADSTGEAWIFHVMTGPNNRSAVWAAQRVPDDQILAAPNTFVIRELHLEDKDNYMASPNVHHFAREMGWWKPEDGLLDFASVYGMINEPAPSVPIYDGRRMWRIYDLVAPSLQLDPTLGYMLLPGRPTYPFSVIPDSKLSLQDVMNVLRDFYEGTEFDLTKGLAAGPFGCPVRYDGDNGLSGRRGNNGAWERAISVFRAVYSFVIQIRPHSPAGIGTTMWFGLDAPHGTVYVPFFCGQQSHLEAYLHGSQSKFSAKSAYWPFNIINNWSNLMFSIVHPEVKEEQERLERLGFAMQADVDKFAKHNSHKDTLRYAQQKQLQHSEEVIEFWWTFVYHVMAKYNNGYVTVGEKKGDMVTPGYPVWWLKAVGYDQWPGKTFTYPSPEPAAASMKSVTVTRNSKNAEFLNVSEPKSETPTIGVSRSVGGFVFMACILLSVFYVVRVSIIQFKPPEIGNYIPIE